MSKNYFQILRAGINTTFQDLGRENLYHIGIPFSGAMDRRNYLISNRLVQNKSDLPVIWRENKCCDYRGCSFYN